MNTPTRPPIISAETHAAWHRAAADLTLRQYGRTPIVDVSLARPR